VQACALHAFAQGSVLIRWVSALTAAFFVSVFSPVKAADYWTVYGDKTSVSFVDKDTLKPNGVKTRAWFLNIDKPATGEKPDYARWFVEFDCDQSTMTLLQVSTYNPDASVKSNVTITLPKAEYVIPESMGAAMFDGACKPLTATNMHVTPQQGVFDWAADYFTAVDELERQFPRK
jgi:hypothetical protein